MNQKISTKRFDLEDRILAFATNVRLFIGKILKSNTNLDDIQQVIRSSGSVGANYIEANEALSKKDFYMRIKICRKEAKETCYWFRLITLYRIDLQSEKDKLIQEATELTKIFGAILEKPVSKSF